MEGVANMTTVTIGESGQIGLSEDVLKESDLKPGSQVVVLTNKGRITLVDRERFEELVGRPLQTMLDELDRSLKENPEAPYFGGLTIDQYAALSEEEDKALWDRLWKDAERKVTTVEQDIPPHYRPAGQKRR
jgi:hypothetical protein